MRRNLTEKEVEDVLKDPQKVYYDLKEGNFIAIKEILRKTRESC